MKVCGAPLADGTTCRQRIPDDAFACWRPLHKEAKARAKATAARREHQSPRSAGTSAPAHEGLVLAPITRAQIARVIDVLNEHGVRFVLIGGMGLDLQGVAITSFDLDVMPERSKENLERLASALRALNARIRVQEDPHGIPFDIHWSVFEARPFLNLVTDVVPLDICLEPAGISGYEELAAHVVNISIGTTLVPVAALEDIAKSKEAARRPKDLRVLPRILAFLAARKS